MKATCPRNLFLMMIGNNFAPGDLLSCPVRYFTHAREWVVGTNGERRTFLVLSRPIRASAYVGFGTTSITTDKGTLVYFVGDIRKIEVICCGETVKETL